MGGTGGSGSGGTGGGAPVDPAPGCFFWATVDNIEDEAQSPPAYAWVAGLESVADGKMFTQYVCRGSPAGSGPGLQIGRAAFNYGCFVPTVTTPRYDVDNIQVLAQNGPATCLQWEPLVNGNVPAGAFMIDGTYICRLDHTGKATEFPGTPMTSGKFPGQLVTEAGVWQCAIEFYKQRFTSPTGVEVLVRK